MKIPDVLLSVCITTFNMEDYIGRAIESVLNQNVNFEFEIIIADDCSTDKTVNILESYRNSGNYNITTIKSDKNCGVVENCSKALKLAKGKYIALLDADDYWITTDKLQKQVEIMEEHSDVDFVYTNFTYVDEFGNIGSNGIQTDFIPPKKCDFQTYLLAPYISPSVISFRRSLLNFELFEVYIQKKFASQEYALFLDFTRKGYGAYLKESTMHYTVRRDSLSRQNNLEKMLENFNSSYETGNWFIMQYPISKEVDAIRTFNFRLKVLLTSWLSNDVSFIRQFTKELKIKDFLIHNPKALYIYIASHNKWVYKMLQPWVLRKRPPGK